LFSIFPVAFINPPVIPKSLISLYHSKIPNPSFLSSL
jgi:hypothetical protein